MRSGEDDRSLRFSSVIAEVLRIIRRRWPTLLVAGLVVFVPLGLIEVIDERLQDSLDGLEAEADLRAFAISLVSGFSHTLAALTGEAIYAGILAGLVLALRDGREHSLRHTLRHLPLGRLIVIDFLGALVTALGFLALLVPGFVFLAWFALIAPAAELEDRGILASFRRSRELVRRRFRLVLGLILPVLLVQVLAASAIQTVSWWGLGSGLVGDWAGSTLSSLLTSPLYGVTVIVLFFGLREAPERRLHRSRRRFGKRAPRRPRGRRPSAGLPGLAAALDLRQVLALGRAADRVA